MYENPEVLLTTKGLAVIPVAIIALYRQTFFPSVRTIWKMQVFLLHKLTERLTLFTR